MSVWGEVLAPSLDDTLVPGWHELKTGLILMTLPVTQTSGLFPSVFPVFAIGQAFPSSPGGWGQGGRRESFLFSLDKSFIHKGVDLSLGEFR